MCSDADVVISVPNEISDNEKKEFLENIVKALKSEGLLTDGKIFSNEKEMLY